MTDDDSSGVDPSDGHATDEGSADGNSSDGDSADEDSADGDDPSPATSSSATDDGGDDRLGIGRRRLLRAGLGLGAAAALVWGVAREHIPSNDRGRITYGLVRPSPDATALEARTREVPVSWREAVQVAFQAQEAVFDAGLSALAGSFVVPGSYDEPQASLSVTATRASVGETLQDLVDDVPVEVEVVEEIPPRGREKPTRSDSYRLQDPDSRDVPGGVVCTGTELHGTLAPALYDAGDGTRYFATSNHVYGAAGTKETAHRGERLSLLLADGTRRIGAVERGFPDADVAKITPVDGNRPLSAIERASPSRVLGQYTRMGIADLAAREEPLVKLGAFSDRTTGRIEGIDGLTCFTGEVCKRGQLKWGEESSLVDGDSGSVNFHPDPERPDEGVLVGGINNARTWWPGADFTWGTAGHHLLDEYGLHF